MSSKKCIAAVKIPIKKAIEAKQDDEFLYYTIEETYEFKNQQKTRKNRSVIKS